MVSTLLAISFAGVAGASVSGVQGLYAHNHIVSDAGIDYSVMDVFIKYNSSVGTGSNGERVVVFGGSQGTDSATFGVDKHSHVVNSLGLAFQHSNGSWLPGANAKFGTGNNTWDSFVTIGSRTQGAGASAGVYVDPTFVNPEHLVGSIQGTVGGPGWAQGDPLNPAFETNTTGAADHMIMIGRFSLKVSDIVAAGGPAKLDIAGIFVGKSTAQTGGTTLYTLAGPVLKSDAQTMYTTNGKTWVFTSSFDGVNSGQEAWTFASGADAVPVPGAAALIGLAGLLPRRRNAHRNSN
ncbi:MAG: hypothetical protein K8R92_11955 [Planctomycetes bacterium]|nr:hypothetical protein [Planctomycetota bacterium]